MDFKYIARDKLTKALMECQEEFPIDGSIGINFVKLAKTLEFDVELKEGYNFWIRKLGEENDRENS